MPYLGNLRVNVAYPSPYDESLSYLEYLARLHEKINELIDLMNSYEENYKEYTDQEINKVKDELNQKVNEVKEIINLKDSNLRDLIQETSNLLTIDYTQLINASANTINLRISSEIDLINSRITNEINALRIYIDSGFIDLKVLNPVTGQQTSVQDALNSLSEQFRANALTSSEYDALQLTASQYDALNLDAYEYDYNGITI